MNNSKLVYGIGLIALSLAVFFLATKAKSKIHFGRGHYSANLVAVADSISLSGVTELNASGACDIQIIPADEERVVFYYDKNEEENGSKVSGTALNIEFDSKESGIFGNHSSDVLVKVYTRGLSKIVQDGVCSVKTMGSLNTEKLTVHNEGVGNMELEIMAKQLDISNQGVGSITLKGNADNARLENGGTGSIDADKISLKNAIVSNQGVGSIELQASETLDMSNQGVGSIEYSGTAKVTRSESQGVGSISKK